MVYSIYMYRLVYQGWIVHLLSHVYLFIYLFIHGFFFLRIAVFLHVCVSGHVTRAIYYIMRIA